MNEAKKIVNIKSHFFYARQPQEGIFDIRSQVCCIISNNTTFITISFLTLSHF